jgi:Na+/proline symporter
MQLTGIDWGFIIGFFAISLGIGVVVAKQAGKNATEFFLSGRHMPWWLLGFSMVATTFSTDTPNLVTDIVRQNGVAGNWVWWAFLLTGMLTVFLYARLWRRSQVLTDVEFYEIRYSGRTAAFLRGFRALYLGVFFNIVIMASVSLAAIKIGGVMLGLSPLQSILIASIVTVCFSTLGGLKGVLLTDFLLFIIAMVGAVAAAAVAVRHPDIGSLNALFTHEAVSGKLSLLPSFDMSVDGNMEILVSVLIIPIAVQWWSVWYPGAEPGGGGYLAQRMLAAKDEKHATGAVLFFNAAHYALRPWPWIIVALCSLIVFPNLESIAAAFPHIPADKIGHDLAYPAMLTYLPHGWLGLVLASLIAAYMSTISTHLNWGSSYVVNDFYKRFVKPEASQKELVLVGRISTVVMMVVAAFIALQLSNALQAFQILLQIGAGTGLLFILRWFWWRINAISEMTAMIVSFLVALYFQFIHANVMPGVELVQWQRLVIGVAITTVSWVTVTLLSKPAEDNVLRSFCRLVNTGGPGWKPVFAKAEADGDPIAPTAEAENIPLSILCMVLGCLAVYGALFAAGSWMYGNTVTATALTVTAVVATVLLIRLWSRVNAASEGETA